MTQTEFLEYYLNYNMKSITIIHYLDKNKFGLKFTKGELRNVKLNPLNKYKKNTMANDIISDFLESSEVIKSIDKGIYKDNMKVLDLINDKNMVIRLISNDLKISFPIIYKDYINKKESLDFPSLDDLLKIKDLIEQKRIKNIFITEDNENFLRIKKDSTTFFEKNYDLNSILKIKYNPNDENVNISKLLQIINLYYNKNKDTLKDNFTCINKSYDNKCYILTFNDGMIYIRSNLVYNKLVDIRYDNMIRERK